MIKKNLSEDDTSAKCITPVLYQSGWTETATAAAEQLKTVIRVTLPTESILVDVELIR